MQVHVKLLSLLPLLQLVTASNFVGNVTNSWCRDIPPAVKSANISEEEFVAKLFKNYQKHRRPPNCNDGNKVTSTTPTIVTINIFVNSISSVSVVDMDYSIDVFLRQRWTDSRLRFSGSKQPLSLNYMMDRLWIPDLFFRNSKEGRLHSITTPNQLLWVFPGQGRILFSQKLSVKLDCPMVLWNFPMDSQVCRVEMGSYGYALNQLDFVWMDRQQVEVNSKLQINEFEFPSLRHGTCVKAYNSTGKFACIFLEFHLVRKFGFYLIYTYLPSILVVMLSWVSFWIDYQAVPARISLGLLSILALITQTAATLQKLPRVSYIKAIDVWLFACLAFVVFSLLEFSLVNVLTRRLGCSDWRCEMRQIMRQELASTDAASTCNGEQESPLLLRKRCKASAAQPNGDACPGQLPRSAMHSRCDLRRQQRRRARSRNLICCSKNIEAQHVDRVSIFLFPLSFLLFNALYWTYFLVISPHSHSSPS